MKGTSNRPIVLKFESSTGLTSLEELEKLLMPYLDVEEILPLYIGSKGKSFIHGLIYINSIHDLEGLLVTPHFIGRCTKVIFRLAAKKDEVEYMQRQDTKLFVSIQTPEVEPGRLKQYFATFGRVEYVKLVAFKPSHPGHRIAEVKLDNQDSVRRVLALHSHSLDGAAMTCDRLNDGRKRRNGMRRHRAGGNRHPLCGWNTGSRLAERVKEGYSVYRDLQTYLQQIGFNASEYVKRLTVYSEDSNLRFRLRVCDALVWRYGTSHPLESEALQKEGKDQRSKMPLTSKRHLYEVDNYAEDWIGEAGGCGHGRGQVQSRHKASDVKNDSNKSQKEAKSELFSKSSYSLFPRAGLKGVDVLSPRKSNYNFPNT